MTKYEILYILNVDHQPKALITKIKKIIETNKGVIKEENIWGKRELAYKINHQLEGYYGVLICETDFINIQNLQKLKKINKDILRMLIINTNLEKNYLQSTILAATKVDEKTFVPKEHPQKFANQKFNVLIPKDAIIDPDTKILTNLNSKKEFKSKVPSSIKK